MKPIYFNNSSTTELSKPVKKIIKKELSNYYNPSDIFDKGLENGGEICNCKRKIAECINSTPEEIIFTSCGSEGDSWLIQSLAIFAREKSKKEREEYRRKRQKMPPVKNQIIVSSIEHKAVLNTCKFLEKNMDFEIVYIKPNKNGYIDVADIAEAITVKTCLVSVMTVNNILGTIQPIREISALCHDRGILFHSDGVQALGNVELDVANHYYNPDAMTFSGHKIHGPRMGFVYINREILNNIELLGIENGVKFENLIHGGGQEHGHRAGTENLPYIKGLTQAVLDATKDIEDKQCTISALTYDIFCGLKKLDEKYDLDLLFTSPWKTYGNDDKVQNNIHFCIPNMSADVFVDALGMRGIYVSSGSACNSGNGDPDYVLYEIGVEDKYLYGGIRLTLNEYNTKKDCKKFLQAFEEIIKTYLNIPQDAVEITKQMNETARKNMVSSQELKSSMSKFSNAMKILDFEEMKAIESFDYPVDDLTSDQDVNQDSKNLNDNN